MPELRQLDLDLIHCDNDIKTRVVLDERRVDLYRNFYLEDGPDALPPIVVFHDTDDTYWLADGYYRVQAARWAVFKGVVIPELPADVHEGTKRDAIFYAAGANAKHGLPLTPHEKQAIVQRLLKDPEWSTWSDREIARHTGTSHTFVSGIRKQLEALSVYGCQIPIAPTRTARRGNTTYQMHTTGIGRAGGSPSTTPTATVSTAAAPDEDDDSMEVIITEGLDELMDAWNDASHAARRAFREWVLARPIEDYGPVVASEDTQRYNAVIAQVCSTSQ